MLQNSHSITRPSQNTGRRDEHKADEQARAVERAARFEAEYDADGDPDQHPHDRRPEHQLDRDLGALPQLRRDRRAAAVREAQARPPVAVADGQPLEVQQVLDRDVVVEPEIAADLGEHLRRRLLAGEAERGIARRQHVEDHERDQRDDRMTTRSTAAGG